MRILQVNTRDTGGGAEEIVRLLHAGYRAAGHEARIAAGYATAGSGSVVEIPNDASRRAWERMLLRMARPRRSPLVRRGLGAIGNPARALRLLAGAEDFDHPGTRALPHLGGTVDVLHMHNLHGGYFDLRELPRITSAVPTVLTLHDAWLTTGHCAHSLDCERWETGCGSCPYLGTYPEVVRDRTAQNWRRKRDLLSRSRFDVVTPSHWLMERIERSIVAPAIRRRQVIPNGIDLRTFSPGSRTEARERLSLPAEAVVLVTVANNLRANPFKNLALILAAIPAIAGGVERPLILLGAGGEGEERLGRATIRFQRLDEPALVAAAYRAADLYLHAANADTFPTTVLEALACGTPVVATRVGGVIEQVRDRETGVLTANDATTFADGTMALLRDDGLRQSMSRAARADAEERFDSSRMVRDYLQFLDNASGI